MRESSITRLLVLVLLLTATLRAENKRKTAEALIRHLGEVSDIRSNGALPFKLQASFTSAASSASGTYKEIWVSARRWQRETTTPDFHRVEMVDGKKRWRLSTGDPDDSNRMSLERLSDLSFPNFPVDKMREETSFGVPVNCVIGKPDSHGGSAALCFDQKTGLLVEDVTADAVNGKIVDDSCVYSDYEAFAGKQFPGTVKCFHDGQPTIAAKLSLTPVVVSELPPSTPPSGAEESVNCVGSPQAPRELYTPEPSYPKGKSGREIVVVATTVGVDGKTRNLRVIGKANPPFDKPALDAVSQWRFQPATCEGQAISTMVTIEVVFGR